MIDIQDLRAGNQVLHNTSGSITTILKVENNKVLLDTFPNSSYYLNTDISGIPLNISILQKLAFTNDQEYHKWQGQGVSIDIKPDGFFYGLRISKNRAKMQYLHELQNYVADFYAIFRQQKYSLNLSMLS